MELRRASHSTERRRRVLIEETSQQLPVSPPVPRAGEGGGRAGSEPIKAYTEAAITLRQLRVVDLIPTRRWTMTLLSLLALTVVAGVEAAHGCLALGYTTLQLSQVPALDLRVPGSVADWFTSCLLLLAAGLGMLTYWIRRHRVDDYRGRYRMWYWVVPLLVVASVDQVADLQGSLRTVLLALAGIPGYPDAAWIWCAMMTVVVTAVATRMALEMRACRLAVVNLVAALACFMALQAVTLDWFLRTQGVLRDMCVAGLTLLGTTHVFWALCFYARYVYREACGEIVARARVAKPRARAARSRRAVPADATATPAAPDARVAKGAKLRVDPPHTAAPAAATAAPAKPAVPAKPDPVPAAAHESRGPVKQPGPLTVLAQHTTAARDSGDDSSDSALSKAERRRQRKLQRREKHQS